MILKKQTGNQGRFLFPLFEKAERENGNEGRFLFPLFEEKWEKEPSLIPIFYSRFKKKSGKRNRP